MVTRVDFADPRQSSSIAPRRAELGEQSAYGRRTDNEVTFSAFGRTRRRGSRGRRARRRMLRWVWRVGGRHPGTDRFRRRLALAHDAHLAGEGVRAEAPG